MIQTFEVRRRCVIGDGWREGGEPVPEAHLWRLQESLIHVGTLIRVEMSESDFVDAVEKYAPGEADEIYAAVGVDVIEPSPPEESGGGNEGAPEEDQPKAKRRAPAKKVLTRAPEPLET